MSKIEPKKQWCGTCRDIRRLLELATAKIEQLPPAEKEDFKRHVRHSFGLIDDAEFLKDCGIKNDF